MAPEYTSAESVASHFQEFDGVTWSGGADVGLLAVGPSYLDALHGLRFRNCLFEDFPVYGALLRYVNDVRFENCVFRRLGRGGLIFQSCGAVRVTDCVFEDVTEPADSYGLAFQRLVTDSPHWWANPPCEDFRVERCAFRRCGWHGADTHGGRKGAFLRNTFEDCYTGIAVGGDTFHDGFDAFAPQEVRVAENDFLWRGVPGKASFAVCVTGVADAAGQAVALAEDCRVVGNTIQGHGLQNHEHDAAVFCRDSVLTRVEYNRLVQCSPTAVNMYLNNQRFRVRSNEAEDVWTDTGPPVGEAIAFKCSAGRNQGTVCDNELRSRLEERVYVNTACLRFNGNPVVALNNRSATILEI